MSLASITRVWEHSKQKGSALLLTLALADIGNDDGFSFPGLDWLAERTRMSKRQTKRLLDQLELDGEIVRRIRNRGRGNRTQYLVMSGLEANRIKRNLMKYFQVDEKSAEEKGVMLSKKGDILSKIKDDKLSKKGGQLVQKRGHPHAQNGDTRSYPKDSIDPIVLRGSDSEIAQAVAQVTGCDPLLNKTQIAELVQDLAKAGYTAQNIQAWYQNFWLPSWRSKGGAPSLKEVRQFIGQVRQTASAGADPYADDPYFTGRDLSALPEATEPFTRYTGKWKDQWQATLDQFSIQLNKSTFDTWLGHLELADVVEGEDCIVEFKVRAYSDYVKDWIERNLMAAFEKNLADICNFPRRPLASGQIGTGVKITLEVPHDA